MRIAYIVADPGVPVFGTKGASVHVQEIVRAFRARGDEVRVYCARRGEHVPADLADLTVVERRVAQGDAAERERAVARTANDLAVAAILDGCDLVYERFSLFSTASALVTLATGAPAVVEVNAPLVEEQRAHRTLVDELGARAAAAAVLSSASVVPCVSEPVARWACAHGARSAIVAPNGVNTSRIHPRALRPADDAPLRVGFVGTLKPWHGTETLVDAMALLPTGRPATLVVIGDGPAGPGLRRRAEELGVAAEFTGAVTPADMPGLLTSLDVGVAPYPERAGEDYFSPLKVYEYLAAGLPVVASRVGQIPAVVRDGVTGVLTAPDDAAALARALAWLRDDPAVRARLGTAARAEAVREHEWARVLTRILQALPAEEAA